jgi:phospholipase/carboxylesterase
MSGEQLRDIAGLRTTVAGPHDAPLLLVLLHGYAMQPSDLSPFAHSLQLPALFLLPRGPVSSPIGGQAWWEVDLESREAALALGPRDLCDDYPRGLPQARRVLGEFLDIVTREYQPRRIILGGFSQGGMLSLDWALRGSRFVDGLVLLSASRIAARDWEPQRHRLRDLPVFVSHGEADQDLSFSAGERLRDFVLQSEARTTWVPFPGGHVIPLVVWRALRKFVSGLLE